MKIIFECLSQFLPSSPRDFSVVFLLELAAVHNDEIAGDEILRLTSSDKFTPKSGNLFNRSILKDKIEATTSIQRHILHFLIFQIKKEEEKVYSREMIEVLLSKEKEDFCLL